MYSQGSQEPAKKTHKYHSQHTCTSQGFSELKMNNHHQHPPCRRILRTCKKPSPSHWVEPVWGVISFFLKVFNALLLSQNSRTKILGAQNNLLLESLPPPTSFFSLYSKSRWIYRVSRGLDFLVGLTHYQGVHSG